MDLRTLFDLECHGADTYVGTGPRYPWGGLYGGQIVAQSLRAAAATVDSSVDAPLDPHSLRAYFIRRGDHSEPVRYEVDRIRNGRSFATRRVVARQAVGAILNLEASFQRPEDAADAVTVTMPEDLPRPDELEPSSWSESFERRWVPPDALPSGVRTGAGRVAAWLKVNAPLGDDELLHRCWLAYLSDDLPTDSVRRALAVEDEDDGFNASLDHTIWFHRSLRADEWHLQDFSCHGYAGGRGLSVGHVFAHDGTHVSTVAQEVLYRQAAAPGPGSAR
jgi:acyl-CoA thioesterase-2